MTIHVARDNQPLGTFGEEEAADRLRAGELKPSDLAWKEGMGEWEPLEQVITPLPPLSISEEEVVVPEEADDGTVRSAANAPLATLGERLGAAMIDRVLGAFGTIPLMVSTGMLQNPEMENPEITDPTLAMVGTAILFTLLVINIGLLVRRGQTVGKRLVGIRIVGLTSDLVPPPMRSLGLRYVVNGIPAMLLFPFYPLLDILLIFGKDRRCLHDLIASTRVIQGQP